MAIIIGFTGFSNSGKTRLISRLVHSLTSASHRCAVVKHDAHGHYKEASGSDSALFIDAGAEATLVVSPDSYVTHRRDSLKIEQLLSKLELEDYDFIFVEGFKQGSHDKIALFRSCEQAQIISQLSKPPIAVVAPDSLREYGGEGVPFFDPDDLEGITSWINGRSCS